MSISIVYPLHYVPSKLELWQNVSSCRPDSLTTILSLHLILFQLSKHRKAYTVEACLSLTPHPDKANFTVFPKSKHKGKGGISDTLKQKTKNE